MDRTKQLGEESIAKLLIKFSIPAIVGMLVNALYNIVDRIFVGRGVSKLALTAITVSFPISLMIMAFGMLVGIGAGAIISIKLGQQKKDEAENILGNSFMLIIIVSILVTIVGIIFLEPLLKVFGASEEALPLAKQFTSIILLGAVLQNIGFGLNNIIRSEGNPKIAMNTMLIGVFLNIIFNPIFIFVFKFGIGGSALATIVSQSVCSIWVLFYFLKGNSVLKIKSRYFKIKAHIVKQIFLIGMSPFLMQITASIVTIFLNNALSTYGGDNAIAAMGAITSVSMLILMPIFGINQGAQPIIGYNYGAKNYKRVNEALKLAVVAASLIATTGFILIEIFPKEIISIFSKGSGELLNVGSRGLRIYLIMLPLIGFQIVCSNYFQAVGKAKVSIFLSLSRQVIILLPLIIILPRFFKLDGVWIAGPISDFLSSLLTGSILFLEMRILKKD
jgi:putative MATE family efflux protein